MSKAKIGDIYYIEGNEGPIVMVVQYINSNGDICMFGKKDGVNDIYMETVPADELCPLCGYCTKEEYNKLKH